MRRILLLTTRLGLALLLLILAINVIADRLRAALDPRG